MARFDYSILKETILDPQFFALKRGTHPRLHAKEIDKLLGYKISKIEQKLVRKYRAYYRPIDETNRKTHFEGTQTWIGLHPEALQTPYSEIFHFLDFLKDHSPKRVIDLGAGYGRVGLVMNALYSESKFIGYEILNERLIEANRMYDLLGLDNCEIRNQDILAEDFVLPEGDIYFIYDFSELNDLQIILDKLSSKMDKKDKFFIVAKGERISFLMERFYKKAWGNKFILKNAEWTIYSSF